MATMSADKKENKEKMKKEKDETRHRRSAAEAGSKVREDSSSQRASAPELQVQLSVASTVALALEPASCTDAHVQWRPREFVANCLCLDVDFLLGRMPSYRSLPGEPKALVLAT